MTSIENKLRMQPTTLQGERFYVPSTAFVKEVPLRFYVPSTAFVKEVSLYF